MSKNLETRRGVLYIATGFKHIKAAIKSANSVRKTNPTLPIHLYSDSIAQRVNIEADGMPFTSSGNINDPRPRSKVDYIIQTPFRGTLYLDADTRVLCDLTDAFDLLKQFDIALPHSPKREIAFKKKSWTVDLPKSFPEFNSGIIFFVTNSQTTVLFERWKTRFRELGNRRDQPSLRDALWQSDLRIATLAPEYNVRFLKYLVLWSKEEAQPKILHLAYYLQGPMYYLKFWKKKW